MDIGAAGVTVKLADTLDAFEILSGYSRLVIDCNRQPGIPESIVRMSEATRIAGNEVVTVEEAAAREQQLFLPYHNRIRTELDTRLAQQRRTILISVHSFTPLFHGVPRPWHAGVLYHRDARLAVELLQQLRSESGMVIGDNEPYAVSDATDYTSPSTAKGEVSCMSESSYGRISLPPLPARASGRNDWHAHSFQLPVVERPVQIRLGYELIYHSAQPTPMILNLNVHYTRAVRSRAPGSNDDEPWCRLRPYRDRFGNRCTRLVLRPVRSESPDAIITDTRQAGPGRAERRTSVRGSAGRDVGVPARQPLLRDRPSVEIAW